MAVIDSPNQDGSQVVLFYTQVKALQIYDQRILKGMSMEFNRDKMLHYSIDLL
jgi:hypothetical protein